jgi:hypothetical protein
MLRGAFYAFYKILYLSKKIISLYRLNIL